MKVNLANFVRQEVRVPKSNPLLPVFEAVSNALDAVAERGSGGTVRVTIRRHPDLVDESRGSPKDFIVEDDGVGFTDANMRSFNEVSTDRKASIGGRGRGRFTYLKVFENIRVTSTFSVQGRTKTRKFDFNFESDGSLPEAEDSKEKLGTRLELLNMKEEYARNSPQDDDTMLRRFIWHFLPTILGVSNVEIIIDTNATEVRLVEFVKRELISRNIQEILDIGSEQFKLSHVTLNPRPGLKHRLILAASARAVDDGFQLIRWMPLLADGPLHENASDEEGFIYVCVVQGGYLDSSVDSSRLGFAPGDGDLPSDNEKEKPSTTQLTLFDQPRSVAEVRNEVLKRVRIFLEPFTEKPVAARTDAINAYIRRDGLGYHFLRGSVPEIARSIRNIDDATIEATLHRVAFEERGRRSVEVRELLSSTPKEKGEQAYFDRWHQIVGRLTDVAKSDLAEHVAHRRAIIDLLNDVIRTTPEGDYRREEVLHSIVFPKGLQSGEVSYEQQNLWLIDERLSFHEHLYSDISIKSISQGDVDSLRRPDLTIFESGFAAFHDEGKPPANVVLVELKRPARRDASRDDPVSATLDYVKKLRSGRAYTESGAVIDIERNALTTAYLLADWTANFREYLEREDFKAMPGDHAQYRYRESENIMFIAYSFSRLIENARMRNRIFFRKLGIES